MTRIFEQGEFSRFQEINLRKSMGAINESVRYSQTTTVFISHSHDDLDDLKGIIGFLETQYDVLSYIDSRDSSMPAITSGVTATNIKERIKVCNKFILLATNGAIDSKWCNWELGFGDAQKYREHIALFPMKSKGEIDSAYRGNEYMSIYPYIAYFNGIEKYTNGTPINKGFYVRTEDGKGSATIEPLEDWLAKR